MRETFLKQADEMKSKAREEKLSLPRVGLEIEYFVIDGDKPGCAEPILDNEHINMELGSFQAEVNTSPIDLFRGDQLEYEILKHEKKMLSKCNGQKVIRTGAFPTLEPVDALVSDKEKYILVPKWHDSRRGDHVETRIGGVDFSSARAMALFSSLQVNVQASSLEDAVDKMNRSLMISPYLVAVSGNARVVAGKDTGIDDIRMLAWSASHDVRKLGDESETRIGTPLSYFASIDDYFDRCSSHPFIIEDKENAFAIGIGLYWLDCRIKFISDVPIVEYRALSTQPCANDDVAMSLFYLGRLAWSQANEELIPLSRVHKNRDEALRHGLRGQLDGKSAIDSVADELIRATQGLELLGVDSGDYLTQIWERLARRKTPAQVFAEEIKDEPVVDAIKKYQLQGVYKL